MLFYILLAWTVGFVPIYQIMILRSMAIKKQKILTYKDILIAIPFGPIAFLAVLIAMGISKYQKKHGSITQ